jgi:hypothetical protein
MSTAFRLNLTLLSVVLLSACATTAPRYEANHAAISDLKTSTLAGVTVRDFTANPDRKVKVETLTLRGGSFKSPYGTFAKYVTAALREELERGGATAAGPGPVIDGVLVRNEINAAGFSTGYADIELALNVRRDGQLVYQASKTAHHEWQSSFVGAVAIPRAMQNYHVVIRKVLAEFYSDQAFVLAIGR